MTANSLYRSVGALTLPLSDTDETTAASLDPGRDILLDLLAAALNDELAARWPDASAGTALAGTNPVQSTCPDELDPQYLQTTEHPFPALAVYRNGQGSWEELDEGQAQLVWGFSVDYVLGPLTTGERRKMADFLFAAAAVMLLTIDRGGHRAYATTPGYPQFPKLVLGPGTGTANFSSCRVEPNSLQRGAAAFSNDETKYWALSFNVRTTELEADNENDPRNITYGGSLLTLGTGTDEGIIEDLVEAATYTAESVTYGGVLVTYGVAQVFYG